MRDDLLARADRAIRESRLVREQARKDPVNARMAIACVRKMQRLARLEEEQSVLYRERASKVAAKLLSPSSS